MSWGRNIKIVSNKFNVSGPCVLMKRFSLVKLVIGRVRTRFHQINSSFVIKTPNRYQVPVARIIRKQSASLINPSNRARILKATGNYKSRKRKRWKDELLISSSVILAQARDPCDYRCSIFHFASGWAEIFYFLVCNRWVITPWSFLSLNPHKIVMLLSTVWIKNIAKTRYRSVAY